MEFSCLYIIIKQGHYFINTFGYHHEVQMNMYLFYFELMATFFSEITCFTVHYTLEEL